VFASVHCPTCRHKFTIPEGAMGNRLTCPNCHAPFLAGKSVGEADVAVRTQPQAAALNRTMLAETAPPITYNCPRCKKPLESPAIEAGTKKHCPGCGQRLQVPAAPPAAQPGLNKTILACNEGNAAPASQRAETAFQAAAASQGPDPTVPRFVSNLRATGVPLWWPQTGAQRTFAIIGIAIAAFFFLSFLTGPSKADLEKYKNAQVELEKLKAEIERDKALLEQKKQFEAEKQRIWDAEMAANKARQDRLDQQRNLDQQNEKYRNDKAAAEAAKAKLDREQAEIDQRSRDAEAKRNKDLEDLRAETARLQRELTQSNQRATTIIQQPAPYYPWHPWRYYPW
jgi:DNA-directed RNA polymerase subunit RPC12/RpoP